METHNASAAKRQRVADIATVPSFFRPSIFTDTFSQDITTSYNSAKPYSHCVIQDLCNPDRLRQVREEVIKNITATYKETDLFKMYQTGDLANMDSLDQESTAKLPQLLALRNALYSLQFRELIQDITGCGELSGDRTDCACNIHDQGGHLLCHDDVIGTRRISFIIYLTDPDDPWTSQDGGALELYPESPAEPHTPDTIPTASVLPVWNSLAMFKVEPGKSFHSIQEVYTKEKPRMSIQGWYHAAEPPEMAKLATLQQLQARAGEDVAKLGFAMFHNTDNGNSDDKDDDKNDLNPLSEEDMSFLQQYVNETYLKPDVWKKIQTWFADEGSVQLQNFLKSDVADKVLGLIKKADGDDKLGRGEIPAYGAGVGEGWELVGPSHKQRYARFVLPTPTSSSTNTPTSSSGLCGQKLSEIQSHLLHSESFGRLLKKFTTIKLLGRKGEIRRFRPGLDYTVAHYGVLTQDPQLDAVLCFVDHTTNTNDNNNIDDGNNCSWEDGEVGGFEAYLLAEDESDAAAEVYRRDDGEETGVLNVNAAQNSLNLILRDEGLMKFVKYVSCKAPGSRWDIVETFLPEDDDDDE
jgi:prolyl 3-hydroxylase /prolyl 3,4-dihydroxylase